MTTQVDRMANEVFQEMQQARTYLFSDTEPAGPCSCIYKARSKHCTTFEYSNPKVPRYGIHDITRIGSSPKKLKELVEANIFALENGPSDIKLTSVQSAQLRAHRNRGPSPRPFAVVRSPDRWADDKDPSLLAVLQDDHGRSMDSASATLESRLDSTKYIIPQILCRAQRVGVPAIAGRSQSS